MITEPTNLYDQADFKSRDVALTFHIGLMLRVEYGREREVPVTSDSRAAARVLASVAAGLPCLRVSQRGRGVPVSWRPAPRVSGLVRRGDTVRQSGPGRGNSAESGGRHGLDGAVGDHLASGQSAAALRSYLKKVAVETWAYVNWLTHAKNAIRMDAEIGLKAVEHLLGVFTAARLRLAGAPGRAMRAGRTRWSAVSAATASGSTRRMSSPRLGSCPRRSVTAGSPQPCTPSSDIATFVTPAEISSAGRAQARTPRRNRKRRSAGDEGGSLT